MGRVALWSVALLAAALAVLSVLGPAAPASANDHVVGCASDNATRVAALRDAITEGFGQVGGTSTVILSAGCIYDLTSLAAGETESGLPTFAPTAGAQLLIEGNGATIRRPASSPVQFRFLSILIGTTVTINDVTFTGGRTMDAEDGNSSSNGGAIYNNGTLTLNSVTFTGNQTGYGANANTNFNPLDDGYTGGASGHGGAIYNSGTLTVNTSTFINNRTGDAGNGGAASGNGGTGGPSGNGGAIASPGPLTMQRTTIAFNAVGAVGSPGGGITGDGPPGSPGQGGGIYTGSPSVIQRSLLRGNTTSATGGAIAHISSGGVLSLGNNTIVDNTAGRGGALYVYNGSARLNHVTLTGNDGNGTSDFWSQGDVAAVDDGTVEFTNSIIWGNGGAGDDCGLSYLGTSVTYTNAGSTLIDSGNSSCPASLSTSDPLLGSLASNGGYTQTRALLAGSPAINAGTAPAQCSAVDQRDVSRPQGSACDIGAFERAATPTVGTITGVNKTIAEVARSYSSNASGVSPMEYVWTVTGVTSTITGGSGATPQITFTSVGDALITLKVRAVNASDAESAQTTLAVHVGPADDLGPTLTLLDSDGTVDEGGSVTFDFTAVDPEGDTIGFAPGYPSCGSGAVLESSTVTPLGGSITCGYPNGPALPQMSLRLEDEYGEVSPERTRSINVDEVAPTIVISGDSTPDEGSAPTYTYTIHEPGLDPIPTPTTDCVNTGGPGTIDKQSGSDTFGGTLYDKSGSLTCTVPNGPENGAVTVTLPDVTGSKAIAVQNLAPSVVVSGPASVNEEASGIFYEFGYAVSDSGPLDEPWGLTVSASCGANGQLITADEDSITCLFLSGPATSTVSITAIDVNGATSTGGGHTVSIVNLPPTLDFFGPAIGAVYEGSTADYSFHAGDGAPESFTITPPSGCAPVAGYIVQPRDVVGTLRCTHADGPASVLRTLTASDGTDAVTDSFTQPVLNVAPTIAGSLSPDTMYQGGTATLALGAITDPGQDTVTEWIVHWGDGATDSYSSAPGVITHQYNESDLFQVKVDLVDEDGTHLDAAPGLFIQAYPLLPLVTFTAPPAEVDEGSDTVITFSITDPSPTATHSIFSMDCGRDSLTGAENVASAGSVTGHTGQFTCHWANGDSTPTVQLVIANSEGEHSPPVSFTPLVKNVAPTVTLALTNPVTTPESLTDEVTLYFTVDDPGSDTLSLQSNFIVGSTSFPVHLCGPGQLTAAGGLGTGAGWVTCRFPDGPVSRDVEIRVSDGDDWAQDTQPFSVVNVAPTVTIDDVSAADPLLENGMVTVTYTVADEGNDSYTASPGCGTGSLWDSGWQYFTCIVSDGPASPVISVTVDDGDPLNNTDSDSTSVTVADVAPTISLGGSEHQPGVLHTLVLGTVTDPGQDTVTQWIVHWGDGATTSYGSATPSPTHTYSTIGPYVITVDLVNEDGTFLAAGSITTETPDTVPPVVVGPGDLTAEATGPDGAAVAFTVTATDDRGGPVSVLCAWTPFPPAFFHPGDVFPLGTTELYCFGDDEAGNRGLSATFDLTVEDTTAPTVTPPTTTMFEATSAAGAVVVFEASAHDLVDGDLAPSCSPAPYTQFAIGATSVTCTATDAHGNVGTVTFDIAVADTLGPVVGVPSDLTVEATSLSGAVVAYGAPTAIDAVEGPVAAPVCSTPSGSAFPLGTTVVTCTATDSLANVGSATFSVTVEDSTAPVVSVPADFTVESTGPTGAVVGYPDATAIDNLDGPLTAGCVPVSGSTFALGTTTVTCTATDANGNVGTQTFMVTVQDATAPTVTAPADLTVEATGPDGAVASYTGESATDAVAGAMTPTCAPASGSLFPVGITTVTCSATDGDGNTGTAAFFVTVDDTADPIITAPADLVVEATSAAGAAVGYVVASATDLVDVTIVPVCAPASGSVFALGTTTVTCTATDAHANQASATFTVTVQDTTAPVIGVPTDITAGGTSASGATVNFTVIATDTVDGPLAAFCSPSSGTAFARATTTVTCTVTDAHLNTASDSFTVTVRGTVTTAPAAAEDLLVEVASNFGFSPGDYVVIDEGLPTEEVRYVEALGSLVFAAPLASSHAAGSLVDVIAPPLGDTTAPAITVAAPGNGQQLVRGSQIRADFACADPSVGVGVQACRGTVADGAFLSTLALGDHSFTVRSWDRNGNATLTTVTYTVVAAASSLSHTGATAEPLLLAASILCVTGTGLLLIGGLRRRRLPETFAR